MKKLKTRIKSSLILKIAKLRKQNKFLKEKIEELILREQEYNDELNKIRSEIRGLRLKNEELENERLNNTKK